MKNLEQILKALGDKNRIRIVKLLKMKKMCVCELASILGITQPSISRHLKKLKAAGIVGDEQDGLWTNYYLVSSDNLYIRELVGEVHSWLNDDPVIKSDRDKAHKVDRTRMCCKA